MLTTAPGWEEGGKDRLAALFVWLRFSQTRQLSWQRRHNTRPMFLSEATEALSKAIVSRWKRSRGAERELMRMVLSTVPRGSSGADGQAIRDEILVIMRKFEIKKRKGTFMEEWHQKLHNNSTPDDITVCEAYIRFLESHGEGFAAISLPRNIAFEVAMKGLPYSLWCKASGIVLLGVRLLRERF